MKPRDRGSRISKSYRNEIRAPQAFLRDGVNSANFRYLEPFFSKKNKEICALQVFLRDGVDSPNFKYLEPFFSKKDKKIWAPLVFLRDGVDSPSFKYLEPFFSKKNKETCALQVFMVDGVDSLGFKYLVRTQEARNGLLQRVFLDAKGGTNEVIKWLQDSGKHGYETPPQDLFGDHLKLLHWLLANGARVDVNTLLLLLMSRLYGDNSPQALSQAEECTTSELARLLMERGARETPRVVFRILSEPLITVTFRNQKYEFPKILSECRSGYIKGFLRFNKETKECIQCINLFDVEIGQEDTDEHAHEVIQFIRSYLFKHPGDAVCNLPASLLKWARALADAWLIEDLVEFIDNCECGN